MQWFKGLPLLLQSELQVITVQKIQSPSQFGMGSPNGESPIWNQSESTFYLYDFRPLQESYGKESSGNLETDLDAVALHETRDLNFESQKLLWRMRALVHATLGSLDRRLGWSLTPQHLRINGWEKAWGRYTFMNQSVWGYARAIGRLSPSLDFVTFGERYFARVQDMAFTPLHPDDTLECQEFSRVRFFEQLFGLNTSRKMNCEAFERFSKMQSFSHFELAFIEPSAAKPESLFGHLFLRPVYLKNGKIPSPLDDPGGQPVLDIGAMVPPQEATLSRILGGLNARYPTVFDLSNLHQTILQQNEREDRKVKFFRVHTSRAENLHLFQRLWELQRRYELPYSFFPRNCGFFIGWLFSHILDTKWNYEHPHGLVVSPSAVMQSLANARDNSQPLIEMGMPPLLAATQRIRRARQIIQDAWSRLKHDFEAKVDLAFSKDPLQRLKFYEEILYAVQNQRALSASESFQDLVFGLSKIEAFNQVLAQKAVEAIDEDRILFHESDEEAFSPRLYLAALQQNQQTEGNRNFTLTKLIEQLKQLEIRKNLARRELREEEKQVLQRRDDNRLALYMLGNLLETASKTNLKPVALQLHEQSIVTQAEKRQKVNLRGGLSRTKFGAGSLSLATQRQTLFGPRIRWTLLEEELGDELALRLSDDVSLRLGDFGLWALWGERTPSGAAPDFKFDLKLIDFKTIHQPLGLSIFAQAEALRSGSEEKFTSTHLELFTGFTGLIWQRNENSSHLFFEAGGFTGYRLSEKPSHEDSWQAGPQLNLCSRVPFGRGKEQGIRLQAKFLVNALPASPGENRLGTKLRLDQQLMVLNGQLITLGIQGANLHEARSSEKSLSATLEFESL